MKKFVCGLVGLLLLASPAIAGDWPDVGDQFRTNDGTLLVVSKMKIRPDVDHSLVCMHRSGTRAQDTSCTWVKVDDLHGDWITYNGVKQHDSSDDSSKQAKSQTNSYNYSCKVNGKTYPLQVDEDKHVLEWMGMKYNITVKEDCGRYGWHAEGNGTSFDFCTATKGDAGISDKNGNDIAECNLQR